MPFSISATVAEGLRSTPNHKSRKRKIRILCEREEPRRAEGGKGIHLMNIISSSFPRASKKLSDSIKVTVKKYSV